MLQNRVIPQLLLSQGALVKTKRFSDPQYIGDPINAVRIFSEKEVDELILVDIDATRKATGIDFRLVEEVASECFIPLTYGGGVDSINSASQIFSLGVEKICLQTACLNDEQFIRSLVDRFGSQSIVVSLDLKKDWLGRYQIWHAACRQKIEGSWVDYVDRVIELGAGELLINCVDREGLMDGLDLDVIKQCSKFPIPVVAAGGVGCLEHIRSGIVAGADAVAVGSLFVMRGPHRAVLINYPEHSDLVSLLDFSEIGRG